MHIFRCVSPLLIATIAVTGCATSIPELPVETPQAEVSQQPSEQKPEQAAQQSDAKALEIVVLHKASFNPFDKNNGKSFKALYNNALYRSELGLHSIETAKPVDFKTSQVLVSSIGEKPSGGYKVSATKAEEFADRVIVTVVQSSPGPSCITTTALTHPFEFVIIPSLKPIEIFERQQTNDC